MTKRQNLTIGQALGMGVLRAVLWTLMLCVGFLAMHMYAGEGVMTTGPSAPSVERPAAKGAPSTVLARMGDRCWTGDAPADMAGKVPGHVVYSDGADGAKVGGSRMVGIALDSIFKKPVKGLTVYAFCR